MYKTPTLTAAKLYQAPVLIDVKAITAMSVCITGGGAASAAK